ncbi:MAG: hypothetical protein E7277_04775, partial [Lachnospiraceae bacterium]|nr:hypothetical protein [Lachnospiraceae bacterium]
MKKYLLLNACVLGILMVLFTACGKTNNESKAKGTEITVPEKLEWKQKKCLTSSILNRIVRNYEECMTVTYEGVTYGFAKEAFNEKEATKFTKAAIELVGYADKLFGVKEHRTEILFNISNAKGKLVVGDKVPFDVLWKVLERVHKVNGGEQYGLFYLYSLKHGLIEKE